MNILILTDNLKTITIISNFLNLNFNIKVSILIANDISSANLFFSEHKIDLIILETKFYKCLLNKKAQPFTQIITISNDYNYNTNDLMESNNISLNNLTHLDFLLHKYNSLSNSIESSKKIILNKLIEIGFNIKHRGTRYIIDSILIYKFYCKFSNIKDIYSILARRYGTTNDNIKSNILKAINYVYCETEFPKLKKFFSLSSDIKPTPKQVILTLSRLI